MIFIENRKKSKKTLAVLYPMAEIIDLTSKGVEPFVQLSPFYPHGGIPVPFSNELSLSVEGIWQGLKVFPNHDIDVSKFGIDNMKGLKRTARKFGQPLGHRQGVNGDLLDYITARKQIYLKSYAWILENKVKTILESLKDKAENNDIVFLDFETNGDIENVSKPISHAALVKRYLEKKYSRLGIKRFHEPIIKKAIGKRNPATGGRKKTNKEINQINLSFEK